MFPAENRDQGHSICRQGAESGGEEEPAGSDDSVTEGTGAASKPQLGSGHWHVATTQAVSVPLSTASGWGPECAGVAPGIVEVWSNVLENAGQLLGLEEQNEKKKPQSCEFGSKETLYGEHTKRVHVTGIFLCLSVWVCPFLFPLKVSHSLVVFSGPSVLCRLLSLKLRSCSLPWSTLCVPGARCLEIRSLKPLPPLHSDLGQNTS